MKNMLNFLWISVYFSTNIILCKAGSLNDNFNLFVAYLLNEDFMYYDFNDTTGLKLNGDAATSNCILKNKNEYSSVHGKSDDPVAEIELVQHQKMEEIVTESTITNNASSSGRIHLDKAGFGHRGEFLPAKEDECSVRMRLTPSRPDARSSVWYLNPLPVLDGFETQFSFQIFDHSRRCYDVKDQDFGLNKYKSCSVHGGDGFAFVIHSDKNRSSTLGGSGSNLGYGGIHNSLAIEFDTWWNPEHSDSFKDHISIHSNGQHVNSVSSTSMLARPMEYDLADGKIHYAKIRYYNELKEEYFPYLSANENLKKFIKDLSENRRMGMLLVYVDEGIKNDKPILGVPINLAVTIKSIQDKAFVGFTSSTGRAWEKHDILSWYYCTEPPCLNRFGKEMKFNIDYHRQNLASTAAHGAEFSAIHVFPDSTPWGKRQTHFAKDRNNGLAK